MPEIAEREPDGTSVVGLQPFACEFVGQCALFWGETRPGLLSSPRLAVPSVKQVDEMVSSDPSCNTDQGV